MWTYCLCGKYCENNLPNLHRGVYIQKWPRISKTKEKQVLKQLKVKVFHSRWSETNLTLSLQGPFANVQWIAQNLAIEPNMYKMHTDTVFYNWSDIEVNDIMPTEEYDKSIYCEEAWITS